MVSACVCGEHVMNVCSVNVDVHVMQGGGVCVWREVCGEYGVCECGMSSSMCVAIVSVHAYMVRVW